MGVLELHRCRGMAADRRAGHRTLFARNPGSSRTLRIFVRFSSFYGKMWFFLCFGLAFFDFLLYNKR